MSLQTFTRGKIYTKLVLLALISVFVSPVSAGWNFDFSRRTKEIRQREMQHRSPSSVQPQVQEEGFFDSLFQSSEPVQELVILNTPTGFVPSTLNVKTGGHYKVHVVNVNEEKKNVSFVLDTFSQHHATYYGDIKSFHIQPKKDGIFTFVCPETSAQGRLVVYPGNQGPGPQVRVPASE